MYVILANCWLLDAAKIAHPEVPQGNGYSALRSVFLKLICDQLIGLVSCHRSLEAIEECKPGSRVCNVYQRTSDRFFGISFRPSVAISGALVWLVFSKQPALI